MQYKNIWENFVIGKKIFKSKIWYKKILEYFIIIVSRECNEGVLH